MIIGILNLFLSVKGVLTKPGLITLIAIPKFLHCVVTGDSVSMVSQLCQYEKPVRIIFNKKFCSAKHIKFCKKLIDEGYAYPFESLLKKCDNIRTFNTTKKISKEILSIIK